MDQIQASSVRVGDVIMLKDKPCKILNVSISKTGKHGGAKVNYEAIDIITNKKIEDRAKSTDMKEKPLLIQKEYILIDLLDDNFTSLLDEKSGEIREDLKINDENEIKNIRKYINDNKEICVTVLKILALDGSEYIIRSKIITL